MLTVVMRPPRTADALRRNPLGIFVNAVDWAHELDGQPAAPTSQPAPVATPTPEPAPAMPQINGIPTAPTPTPTLAPTPADPAPANGGINP